MLLKRIAVLFILPIILCVGAYAQPWAASIPSADPDFKEIQNAFYQYWQGKTIEKGQGYKPFKRWEWYFQQRLLPNGHLPSSSITLDNWNDYLTTHPQEAQKELSTTAANWNFAGPSSSMSGYSGIGRVNCIAFHPTDANTFWVGTPAGGIWRTTDGGVNWTTNSDNMPVLGVSDIAVDPLNPDILYIATGDGDNSFALGTLGATTGGNTKSIGILRSTDGGNTWASTGLNWNVTQQKLIRRLVINPANPQVLLAAASDGIWKTTNGGTSWSNVLAGYFMDLEFKPGNPNTVYASTYSPGGNAQIFTSSNGGDNWNLAASLMGVTRSNMSVSAQQPNLVDLVGVNLQNGLAGLYYSSNSGASFTKYYTGNNSNNLLHNTYNANGSGGQGHYDLAYALNPVNGNEIWLGGVNTWKSIDGGTNWSLKNMWSTALSQNPNSVPVVHADKHFLAFHPLNTNQIFECNDGGLYRSSNGGSSWTDLSNGLGIGQLYRLGVSATVPNLVFCGLQDNGSKLFSNNQWSDQTGGDGMECIIDHTNPNIRYSTYVQGLIYKTIDGGATWTQVLNNNTASGPNSAGEWVTPYLMHPVSNNTLIVGKDQVYQTLNGGVTWSQLGVLPGVNNKITAMAYAPSNPLVIYVATPFQVFKTLDGGINWALITTSTEFVTYITVDPVDPQRIWLTNSGYTANDKIWYSANGGVNWSNYSGSLPNLPVNCIVYQKGSNDGLYVGTDAGIFYRDASLTDWVLYNTGLPHVVVTELEISYSNNKIWAATFGRGLWSSDLYSASSCSSLPAAPASGGDQSVCQNAVPAVLTVTPPAGSTVDWYSTASGGTPVSAGNNNLNVSSAGTWYAESRMLAGGCISSSRTPVSLSLKPTPPPPVISQNGNLLQSSALSGNQWYLNGNLITGATGQNYTALANGLYTVRVTLDGCPGPLSAGVNYVATSLNEPAFGANLLIAPNPVLNTLNIRYLGTNATFTVILMDISGKKILNKGKLFSEYNINMHRFSSGTYLIRIIQDKTGATVQRIIVKAR